MTVPQTHSITESEAYVRLSRPYNPPVICDTLPEADFYSEWHYVQRGLVCVLNEFGQNDAYGQGDYYVGDSAALSRGINVSVTSEKLFVPSLIPAIQKYLQKLDQAYEINFTLCTRDGDFEIFVSSNDLLAWVSQEVGEKLGLNFHHDGAE